MRDAPQAGLDASQHDGAGLFEGPADQVAVDDTGAVRTARVFPAGRVVVLPAPLARGRPVGHQRIDPARRDAPEQRRFTESRDIGRGVHIGLRDDAHPIAGVDQDLANDGRTDEGGVDVAVAGHEDDVEGVPAQGGHFFAGGG